MKQMQGQAKKPRKGKVRVRKAHVQAQAQLSNEGRKPPTSPLRAFFIPARSKVSQLLHIRAGSDQSQEVGKRLQTLLPHSTPDIHLLEQRIESTVAQPSHPALHHHNWASQATFFCVKSWPTKKAPEKKHHASPKTTHKNKKLVHSLCLHFNPEKDF